MFEPIARDYIAGRKTSTQEKYDLFLREWLGFLERHECKPDAATELLALRFRNYLIEKPGVKVRGSRRNKLAKSTIHTYIVVLHAMYSLAVNAGAAKCNPFALMLPGLDKGKPGEKRESGLIDDAAIDRLLSLPDVSTPTGLRDAVFLNVLWGGALRISEALNLTLGSLQYTERHRPYLILLDTKTASQESQAIPLATGALIEGLIKLRRSEGATDDAPLLIMYSRALGAPTGRRMQRRYAYNLFIRYCKRAGIKGASPHSMRGSAITSLLKNGVPHREVKDFSRHKSVQMVETYDKRRKSIDTVGELAEKLSRR
jgi:integrase/recombinase XerD